MWSLPRHAFNLLTGVVGGLYCIWIWSCSAGGIICIACGLVLCTTILFHGAHVLGRCELADRVLMKYDVGAVISTSALVVWNVPASARWGLIIVLACCLGLWLPTFTVLKGLPQNPIQSALHMVGVMTHRYAASYVCAP